MRGLVVAMTGASGSVYAVRLVEVLIAAGRTVHLTISPAAVEVFKRELGLSLNVDNFDIQQILPRYDQIEHDDKLKMLKPSGIAGYAASSVFSDSEIFSGKLVYHHYRDYSAGIALAGLLDFLKARDITFALARADSSLTKTLDKYGLLKNLNVEHLYGNLSDAVVAFDARQHS